MLERDGSLTPEQRVELAVAFRAAAEALAALQKVTPLTGDKPGRVACPARCVGGKQPLAANASCKYCKSKGGFDCKDCKKAGKSTCTTCSGAKRLERRCDDCAGDGQAPDPLRVGAASLEKCPWCEGLGHRTCAECDEHGRVDAACERCTGKLAHTCPRCVGTSKSPCKACQATGLENPLFRLDAAASKPASCRACAGVGSVDCEASCKQGRVVCESCKGARDFRPLCRACNGTRKHPCFGCHRGAHRSWEWASEQFEAAGDVERARKCLEIALARVDPRYEALLRESLDPDAAKSSLARARDADRKRVKQRLDALSASKD